MTSSSDAARAASDSGQTGAAKRPERKSLGKYEIQKKIGAGGMGTVFLALDTELRRTVALKILPRERAQNEMLVRRFKAEGEAAAHLRHENLVSVFDAGEIDGHLYLALEYVDGTDVHRLVEKRGPVPVKRSIAIVRQVARALAHAHEQNIVHRDIKPSNLLIQRDGSVKLTDFGLARSLDEETETSITRAGTTVGTVDYMSPEQARDSKSADIRSDLYSLGCTWYHMLTGGPPYPEGAVTNKLQAHASAPLPDPRDRNESVPEGVVAIMHRLMAKDPDARYQTPKELLEDLDSAIVNRQSLSNNVLAALADGDSDRPARTTTRSAPPPAEPPPTERKPVVVAPVSSRQVSPELVKYAIVGLIVVAVLVLLGWIVSQFASTMDAPNTTNPFHSWKDDVPRYVDETIATDKPVRGPDRPGDSTESAPEPQPEPEPLASTAPQDPPAPAAEPSPDEPAGEVRSIAGAALADPAATGRVGQVFAAAVPARSGEQAPEWIGQAPELTRPATGSDNQRLPVLTVGRADGGPAQFARLETALSRVPRTGGMVQLVGPGPFELTPTRIATAGPVVLEAAKGERPVVLLRPDREGAAARVLQVDGGSLSLVGLDLVAVGTHFPTSQPLALVEVLGGGLTVRGCTVTLRGRRSGPTVAFRALAPLMSEDGPAKLNDPGRVLLDRVFVRGAGLSAVSIVRRTCDVVASNCLFVTGAAPSVAVADANEEPGRAAGAPARAVRFLSTTAVSSGSAFHLEHHRGEPPETLVAIANSVVAAPVGSDAAMLVELGPWPGTERSAGPQMAPRNLKFNVVASVFPGWQGLIRAAARPQPVADAAGWTQVWRQLVQPELFPAPAWPRRRFDPESAPPEQFDAAAASPANVVGTDGEPPGCLTGLVPVPAPEFVRRAAALAERPVPPEEFDTGPLGARTIRVDVAKQDLGAVISAGDWPSGTRFIVEGSGARQMQSVEVRGKSMSIDFVPSGGEELWIEPRPSSAAGGGRALFAIEDGTLRLTGGRFRLPSSAKGDVPRWFLDVTDGDFALTDCHIKGPLTKSPAWEGFIRWDQRERPDTAPRSPGRYEGYGQIARSYLCGYGTLVRADLRGRALVARGSVLASVEDAFQLDVRGDDPRIRAAVELSNCTVSAGGTFFDVEGQRGRGAATSPLRLFIEQTVFAPPLDPEARAGPVLFRDASALARQGQIEWWGRDNGYAAEIGQFLVESSAGSTERQKFSDAWQSAWGAAGELRPLVGPDDVRLARGDFSPPGEITASDFALHEAARARTWSASGTPIGADAESLARP